MAASSSNTVSDQDSLFSIRVGQLAGGTALKGIKKYATTVENAKTDHDRALEIDNRQCTCTCIALSVLALIAAAGAVTLIALSGGPNNTQLFYTGVALGIIALVLLGGVVYKVVDTIRFGKNQEVAFAKTTQDPVSEKVVLKQLEEAEVETIEEVIKQLDEPDQRKNFFGYIHENYFPEEEAAQGDDAKKKILAEPLSEEQKKVLSVLAKFPNDIKVEDDTDRGFALEILRNIDPTLIDSDENSSDYGLMRDLFNKVGAPATLDDSTLVMDELQIFARHPKAVARLAQNVSNAFTPEVVEEIFVEMSQREQARFLRTMANDFADLADDHVNDKNIITQCITFCIPYTFNNEFVDLIANGKPAEEDARKEYKDAKILLKELARWPKHASFYAYVAKDPLLRRPGFINAIYEAMQERDQKDQEKRAEGNIHAPLLAKDFVDYAAATLPDTFDCANWINEYVNNNVMLSKPTMLVFARKPIPMALAMSGLASPRAKQYANEILALMTQDNLFTFLNTEKNHSDVTFKARVQEMLAGVKRQPSAASPESLVVRYFKQNVNELQAWTLDNKELGDEGVRREVVLNLLEQMGEKAEDFISSLDLGLTPGYSYFNSLVNKLADQVKDLDLGANPNAVSETRKQLIARFMHAPQMVKARNTGFGLPQTPDGPIWNNFRQLAGASKDAARVWQPRQN